MFCARTEINDMSKRSKTVNRIEEDVFVAVAHPVRRDLLQRLAEGEMSVAALCEPYAMSRSAVGQHLDILFQTGLVTRTKQGRMQFYRLQLEKLREIRDWISYFERHWQEKLDALESYLDQMPDDDEAGGPHRP